MVCAERIGAAVTTLSTSPDHHSVIGDDTMLLWWRSGGGTPLPLARLLTDPDPAALGDLDVSGQHCALLLGAGVGRMSMRFLWDEPAADTVLRIGDWYDRTAVYDGDLGRTVHHGIGLLHRAATSRWNPVTEKYFAAPTRLRPADLWTAALTGTTPRTHGEAALAAIRADGMANSPRAAMLRVSGLAGE
ncbi:type I-C CRISPR-associated protein Cas8c/Csd1 [Streptomyces harbinensis]|uniref:CRISPR-associated protein (Cas_Csd1) n=1 Tax=Streptomyces harbinensis TaxID=1176198 RepID=A0A1I6WDI4_9ACTN|nr:type I-C CRISPR-associated protein Cas8c/Csd1 [Streptomyces harbinensis]SFT24056.1 CRISPR-associated protein (Cas_Csd1) [Streptomyces harbinensis]